jgi:hypothetical protein
MFLISCLLPLISKKKIVSQTKISFFFLIRARHILLFFTVMASKQSR